MLVESCCGCPPRRGLCQDYIILAGRELVPLMPAWRSYARIRPSGWRSGKFSLSPDVNICGMGKKVSEQGSGVDGGHYDRSRVCRAVCVVPLRWRSP